MGRVRTALLPLVRRRLDNPPKNLFDFLLGLEGWGEGGDGLTHYYSHGSEMSSGFENTFRRYVCLIVSSVA